MMDGNKLDELRELVEFLKANGIAEFEMEHEGLKVKIKFAGEPAVAAGLDMAQLSRLMASAGAAACSGCVRLRVRLPSAAAPARSRCMR